MATSKPFPAITGGCACNAIRYRLLTAPLFCYACHCPDCQKTTGSAFGLFLNIETYNIRIISPTRPIFVARFVKKPNTIDRHVECPACHTELWANNARGPAICDVRVGTLDFPSLMEPDVHSFVESKLDWIRLPEGARSTPADFDATALWPKSSLKRMEVCFKRVAEIKKAREVEARAAAQAKAEAGEEEEIGGEGDKTPTAVEFNEKEIEDDEAFEKRFKAQEAALRERLEKLTLKLEKEEGKEGEGDVKTGENEATSEVKTAETEKAVGEEAQKEEEATAQKPVEEKSAQDETAKDGAAAEEKEYPTEHAQQNAPYTEAWKKLASKTPNAPKPA